MQDRPVENRAGPYLLTASNTTAVFILGGARGASFECTAASTGTCTVQVQFRDGGAWHNWRSYEFAPASGFTARAEGTTITLVATDSIFVYTPTCYAVRITLTGTSMTLYAETSESIDDLVTYLSSAGASTLSVQGDVAHDAANSGNPLQNGGVAVAFGATPTEVTAGDRTRANYTKFGAAWVLGGHMNATRINVRVLDADGAQSNIAIVTVSSGTMIGCTLANLVADGSNTAPINIALGFAAATLATPNTTSGAGIIADFPGAPAGGGMVEGNGAGLIAVGADGEDMRYTCEDPVGGAIAIGATYFLTAA